MGSDPARVVSKGGAGVSRVPCGINASEIGNQFDPGNAEPNSKATVSYTDSQIQ